MSEQKKINKVSAIKAYFASPSPGCVGMPLRDRTEDGGKAELMECATADKPFYRELCTFCVAECDRLEIPY